jgi:hypothetical protein
MKAYRTLLLIALFAACKVLAQQQTQLHSTHSSASDISTVEKSEFHWLAPANPPGLVENRNGVAGLDTRPWTEIVGWHPGESAFPNAENFSTEMPLFCIGQWPNDQN